MFITLDDKFKLQQKAIDALQRIKNDQHISETQNTRQFLPVPNSSKISYLIEHYDDESFNNKLNHDIAYYNVLLNNLEPGVDKNKTATEVEELFEIVNEIYKEIDAKAQTYGGKHFNNITSEESFEKEAYRIITEHIDKNYYSLNIDEKDKKYKDETILLANRLIEEENLNIDEAVSLSQKKIILEGLLNKIAFPLIIKGRIDEMLTESQNDEFFDNSRLISLYEMYSNKIEKLSFILASIL